MNEGQPVANTTKHELKPVKIKEKKGAGKSKKGKTAIPYTYSWQRNLGKRLDEMVDSFLDFPPDTPQDYQDEQFARHLLWNLGDARSYFVRLFRHGTSSYELDCLWARLFPFITGDFPEDLSPFDGRLVGFSFEMNAVLQDYIARTGDFNKLMQRIIMAIDEARKI